MLAREGKKDAGDALIILSFSQVALVFPNNDPAAFMVAFYGCLLAEVVPVPIEVPLTRKVKEMFLFLLFPLKLLSDQIATGHDHK